MMIVCFFSLLLLELGKAVLRDCGISRESDIFLLDTLLMCVPQLPVVKLRTELGQSVETFFSLIVPFF